MANHGFVRLKTRINAERLEEELQRINQARFKGKMKIRRDGGPGKPLFQVEFLDGYPILFWLASSVPVVRHLPQS